MPGQDYRNSEVLVNQSIYERGLEIRNNFYMRSAGGWYLGIAIFIVAACFSFPIAASSLVFTYIAQVIID